MYAQLRDARIDAHIRLSHAGSELGLHRARIVVHRSPPPPFELRWDGETTLALPHGSLEFVPARGRGIAVTRLAATEVTVRSRRGGERIQLGADRPPRAVKSLLREAGIPEWNRHGLPLVWCGDSLAAIPGIGVDHRFAAAETADGLDPVWTER
jgi:tRNA(Ile)-lysidine synthase